MNANTKQTHAPKENKVETKVPEAKAPETKTDAKPETKAENNQVKPQDTTSLQIPSSPLETVGNLLKLLNFSELRQVQSDLSSTIKERQAQEIAKAREQITAIAQSVGVPVAELLNTKGKNKTGNLPGVPLPAMYKNPETGETWSGRGRQPKWVYDHLIKSGGDKSAILVKHD